MNGPSFHDNKKWGPWVFIPKPKAVQWPHETCIGFQILDNFSMHRGIQPKRWIPNWTAYPYWHLLLYTFVYGLYIEEKNNRIILKICV